MSKLEEIVLIKGRDTGNVYLQEITLDDIRAVFFPLDEYEKYRYIGISYNIFRKGSENYLLLQEFYRRVGKRAKPWWCPMWVLRLTHLFGNDNSIIRVRNWKLYRLHKRLTDGIIIQQVKTKYGTLRVYGSLDEYLSSHLKKLENKINPTLEAY